MAKVERVREVLTEPLSSDYLRKRMDEGWRPVAVEWQRESASSAADPGTLSNEVPYGLRISEDGKQLAEEPAEKQALMLIMEKVVQDSPFSEIAAELNRQGFRTRQGFNWNEATVFDMLPRLIDAGPQLLDGEEWVQRRKRLVLSASAGYERQDRPRH